MFGFRTPMKEAGKATDAKESPERAGPSKTSAVRRSIGDWESGKVEPKTKIPSPTAAPRSPPKPKPKTAALVPKAPTMALGSPVEKPAYVNRTAEARACLNKAKLHLSNSRNLKTDIKMEVTQAIERLYQLVKEAEVGWGQEKRPERTHAGKEEEKVQDRREERTKYEKEMMEKMERQGRMIQESSEKLDKLKETIERQSEVIERTTYASVVAGTGGKRTPEQTALHSVVITAKDETETGEEVLNRIRKAVNAKEGGVAIERIRKAKDRKIIVGCRTERERQELKERLGKEGEHLKVEEIRNKDPLLILKDVLAYNTDEEVVKAIRNQNGNLLGEAREEKIEVAYKKRTRNPHTNHVVLRVSPRIWQKMTKAESVHIDLQRVRVADQSPLIQCSMCLGYGHGRRFCKESIPKCSHCGGPHLRSDCAEMLAGAEPTCCNCTQAKLSKTDHNAFSHECTIRRKWEALARATIAYC